MKSLIRKIACAVMALTLIAGVFTGCSKGDTTFALNNSISLKEQNGSLPETGTVGDIEYTIHQVEPYNANMDKCGYYIDMLEQLDSPYFVVITSGTKTTEGAELKIVDMGMDGNTLQILVEEKDATGLSFTSPYAPSCMVELDHMPGDIQIHSTSGKEFKLITPD